jgi:hypothetical protein
VLGSGKYQIVKEVEHIMLSSIREDGIAVVLDLALEEIVNTYNKLKKQYKWVEQ